MKSDLTVDVAIVGGGFSGTMAAAHLTRAGLRVALIEGGGRAGQGVAYATCNAVHLLNVPAARMSAWPDAPDDFVATGHAAESFAPRRDFGRYLQAILDRAVIAGLALFEGQAVAAAREGERWRLTLSDSRVIVARALVLANGNQPSESIHCDGGVSPALIVNDPWGGEAAATIGRLVAGGGDALILGTGLTMIDMVLSLDAAGHKGRIVALSRRGQLPRAHAAHDPAPVDRNKVPEDLGRLMPWLRARSARVGWRAAVDALRPHAQALWHGFDRAEQGRFLRHVRPYWDVHRHRIAPQVAGRVKELISEGQLEIVAGRVSQIGEIAGGLVVGIRQRGPSSPPSETGFAAVFNCTGPLGAMARTRDPLLRQMIGERLVSVDQLGIGLAVDPRSRAGAGVWALGPLTKGEFWEIVAVPDIRGQVAQVADDIAKELCNAQS